VYTGLQDNGSWGGPSATRSPNGILNSDWFGIGGGDGFQTAVDPADYNIVYTESQDGNTNRYDLRGTGRSGSIRPRGPGERGRGFGGAGTQGARGAGGARGATGAAGAAGAVGATGAAGATGAEEQMVTPPQQAAGAFGGR